MTEKPATTMQPDRASDRRSPLIEGYYAENFATLLATVVSRYGALLRPEEQAFQATFSALDRDARRLYVRLLSRKGPCIRRDRLRYDEIDDLEGALERLMNVGFVDDGEDLPPAAWLSPLVRAELRVVAQERGLDVAATIRKADLIAALVAQPARSLASLRAAVAGVTPMLRVQQGGHVELFCLLFFGNLHQDWNAFVLRDLGLTRFEPYELDPSLRRFSCRESIDQTLMLGRCRAQLHEALDAKRLDDAVALCDAVLEERWHPEAQRRVDRIAADTGRALERAGRLHEALRCYEAVTAPPTRERRARVLAQLGALDAAVRLCEEIAAAPRDEVERLFAPRFADRLRRKRGERLPVRPRRRRPQRLLTLTPSGDRSVEGLVLDHWRAEGQQGFFAENWLWNSLFGLAFWDIIFAPVTGAFEHPFQLGPRDLRGPAFRARRASAIEQRLDELRTMSNASERLLATFEAKQGTANALVSWHERARDDVALALDRLTGPHLAWVFDRFSREIGRYRRGFPDLFVTQDDAPGFALFEVKGPGDQLRPEQRTWIDHLNAGGLPTFVVPVTYRA